jgi:glucose/arabinose dehydrogenase
MKRIAAVLSFFLGLSACSSEATIAAVVPPRSPTSAAQVESISPLNTSAASATVETITPEFPPPPVNLRPIASGLNHPVFLTNAGDGSGRLFLVEKPGTIRIVKDGALLADPFLDIRDLVKSTGSEQGLLGLAFDPGYAADGRFFVNYIDRDGNTVVARYRVSSADPDRADPASGTAILAINQPYPNHNGGDMVFGPDGYLYIGTGDGGSEGDPLGNGQRLDTLLGKLLRLDVQGDTYAIPADNPFLNRQDARPEIWAYGLRNPWRFSFDRETGDLYIGDVGQDSYEEIDFQPPGSHGGENYGWNIMEGFHPYKGGSVGGLAPPVAEYDHTEGNCSVTGGYAYRGTAIPSLSGTYVFGDYCTGQTWVLHLFPGGWGMAQWFGMKIAISSFGEDENGELYVLDYRNGQAFRVEL